MNQEGDGQHGFRPRHSTTTASLEIQSKIVKNSSNHPRKSTIRLIVNFLGLPYAIMFHIIQSTNKRRQNIERRGGRCVVIVKETGMIAWQF